MPLGNKENPDKIENEAVSSNIFDDFDANDSLVQEVEKLKTEYNKDIFYYV
ncbi:MAG: hypothetical protein P1U46_01150 [Patescibacteria group bacterium]|nr:hypothetical protein [Patescibacteria group bacterium]